MIILVRNVYEANHTSGTPLLISSVTYDLQKATYRFILSMSISPTVSSCVCRFMWMFMTCLAIVCGTVPKRQSVSAKYHSDQASLTRSRISLCSSLTMKIISKRDKMVVWKSMFWKSQGISIAEVHEYSINVPLQDSSCRHIDRIQGSPLPTHSFSSSRWL